MSDDGMEAGLRIVLSPGQLAAIVGHGTLEIGRGHAIDWTRAWGGLKLVFGGLEELGAAALILAPDPTTLTKWAGGALAVHGADTMQSGGRQLWAGREVRTLTSEGSGALASALGVDDATAAERRWDRCRRPHRADTGRGCGPAARGTRYAVAASSLPNRRQLAAAGSADT